MLLSQPDRLLLSAHGIGVLFVGGEDDSICLAKCVDYLEHESQSKKASSNQSGKPNWDGTYSCQHRLEFRMNNSKSMRKHL